MTFSPIRRSLSATPVGTLNTTGSEYMSFGDDYLFLGHLRPDGGASKINVSDPKKMAFEGRVWGRLDVQQGRTAAINDDQFTVAIGPLLVMGDDQAPYRGSVIAVHSATPDTKPPIVDTVIPRDKTTVSAKSRIGISFSDNIELATVNAASFIVRPVGGQALPGTYGSYWGVLDFDPAQDLAPGNYEVVLPEGGITDLVGNGVHEFKSTFTVKLRSSGGASTAVAVRMRIGRDLELFSALSCCGCTWALPAAALTAEVATRDTSLVGDSFTFKTVVTDAIGVAQIPVQLRRRNADRLHAGRHRDHAHLRRPRALRGHHHREGRRRWLWRRLLHPHRALPGALREAERLDRPRLRRPAQSSLQRQSR